MLKLYVLTINYTYKIENLDFSNQDCLNQKFDALDTCRENVCNLKRNAYYKTNAKNKHILFGKHKFIQLLIVTLLDNGCTFTYNNCNVEF